MKTYKKQIDNAKTAEVQKQAERIPREPKTVSQNKEARINFMQGIVRDARVRQ